MNRAALPVAGSSISFSPPTTQPEPGAALELHSTLLLTEGEERADNWADRLDRQ
jgi:hypothetical protein